MKTKKPTPKRSSRIHTERSRSTSTGWEKVETIGNKLLGDTIGIIASRLDLTPSIIMKEMGEETLLELLEEHDKGVKLEKEKCVREERNRWINQPHNKHDEEIRKEAVKQTLGWEKEFDKRFYNLNTPSGLNHGRYLNFKLMVDDIKSFVRIQKEKSVRETIKAETEKTEYLLKTFVWKMEFDIGENRRRLNKFVLERETNIEKLLKSSLNPEGGDWG